MTASIVTPRQRGRGAREGYFVYAPSLVGDTFLHLSVRGGSYRLRNFRATGPHVRARAELIRGYQTIDELLSSHLIARRIAVTPNDLKQNVVSKPNYWHVRIAEVNVKEL